MSGPVTVFGGVCTPSEAAVLPPHCPDCGSHRLAVYEASGHYFRWPGCLACDWRGPMVPIPVDERDASDTQLEKLGLR